jgi:hypothetical protein
MRVKGNPKFWQATMCVLLSSVLLPVLAPAARSSDSTPAACDKPAPRNQ